MNLFDLVVKLSVNMDDYSRAINQAKAKLDGFGKGLDQIGTKFKNVGIALTAAVTTPIVGLATAAAKTAISFLQLKENTTTAFKTMFGSAEKATKMVQDIYNYAQRMPYSYQSYLEASKALVAMGVSAENVIPYLENLSDAAAATGSGAEGIGTLSLAIGRMSSKGKVQLEDLQMFTNMGVQAVNILGNSYGITTEKIYYMMKKGELLTSEALPKLLDGMKNGTKGVNGMTAAYGGLAESMEGTLTGAIDTLSARWRDFSTKLFDSEKAYPVLTKLINNVAAAIQKLPKVFEAFSSKVAPFLEEVNKKIEEFSEWIDKASDEDLVNLVKWLGILVALGPALIALGGAFKALSTASTAIAFLISPTGLMVLGIAALAAGFIYLWQTSAEFKNFWVTAWDTMRAIFTGFMEKTGIIKTFQSIGEKVVELWNKLVSLKDLFIVIGATVGIVLSPIIVSLMGMFNALIKTFDGVMTRLNGLVEALSGLGKILVGVFTLDKNKILDGFKTLWNGIKKTFQGGLETIWGWFSGYYKGIYDFFSTALNKLGITEAFRKIGTAISDWLSSVKTSISTWFDESKKTIGNKLDGWKNKIVEWHDNTKETTTNKFNEWKTAISTWFEEKKNTLVKGFNAWWDPIEIWFSEKKLQITVMFENIKSEVKKVMDEPNYLITLMDGWATSLNEWSDSKIELFLSEFVKWKTAISGWFTEKKDTFVNGFNEWWNGVIEWFNGLPESLRVLLALLVAPIAAFFPQAWEKVGIWFEENKNTLADNFNIWWENLGIWFEENKNTLADNFNIWWENLGIWFENTGKELTLKFDEWGAKISTWFTEKKDTFVNGFIGWWNNAGEWITQTAQDIPKKFEEWKNTISEWFKNLGKSNMKNMGDGIDNKTQEPDFILKLGRTILKLLGAVVLAVGVGIIAVGYAIVEWIWQGLQKGWNWLLDEAPKLFNKLGTKINEIFNNISTTVSGWIEKIKGFFNFSWSLPKLKMPHFKVSGSFSLNPLSVPSFGIDWYAKGGILNNPTMFGFNPFSGNAMVGGEAGPEAITPIDKLQDYVKAAVKESETKSAEQLNKAVGDLYGLLNQYLPGIASRQVVLSTGETVGALTPYIDNNLGVTNALKLRGNA